MEDVDWLPALLALAAGLVGGAIVAWRVYRTGQIPATASSSSVGLVASDLETRSEALLRQLRELDDAAAKRTPEQLARERYALELEAARTWRELDETRPEAGATAPSPEPVVAASSAAAVPADRPALRGFLWGTGTMASLGLLLFLLSRSTHERREGGTLTGNLPGEEAAAAPQADAELAQLEAAVARSPDDIEARIALARGYLTRQQMMAVWNQTKFVLERSPGEPRALSYQALVRLAMGQGDLAAQMLTKAIKDRPDFLEGYLHLAIVYLRTGRAREADATIERAARLFPGEEKDLREVWSGIRQEPPAETSAEVRDPHTSLSPPPGVDSARPGAAAAPPPRAAAPDGKGVRGTVDLDPALKSGLKPAILFVMLRPDGFGAGPPLAAKRIPVSSFPVTFDIGPGDSMTGEALPDTMLLQARLDSDGDPTTRDPADPVAQIDGVKNGSRGITLTLARRNR